MNHGTNRAIVKLSHLFEDAFNLNNVYKCCFLPNGQLTFVNNKIREELKAEVGDNFFDNLPDKEKARVKKHLDLYTHDNPVRSHLETINLDGKELKIRWINAAIVVNDSPIEFESVGWLTN